MNNQTETGRGVKFERIRRITGYLVGTLDRFNNAKRSEEKDRIKHSVGKEKNIMEKRLIYADDPYDKILGLANDMKNKGRHDYVKGLYDALDYIEMAHTVDWKESEAKDEPKKL